MTNAKGLIDEIRRELQSVEREIRDHPYLAEIEASGPFFHTVLGGGESAALEALKPFARAVGADEVWLQAYEPAPGAQAYPAFMAWLALYGSDAEVAAGFLVAAFFDLFSSGRYPTPAGR